MPKSAEVKILIYHRYYGCETGCCGHAVALFPDGFVPDDDYDYYPEKGDRFNFSHLDDDEDKFEYAKELVAREFGISHVADLDIENSFIVDYHD